MQVSATASATGAAHFPRITPATWLLRHTHMECQSRCGGLKRALSNEGGERSRVEISSFHHPSQGVRTCASLEGSHAVDELLPVGAMCQLDLNILVGCIRQPLRGTKTKAVEK